MGPDIQKGTEMIINGKEDVAPITVAELVEQRGLRADRVAVELNGEIVPRAQRAQTQLKGTDTLGNRHIRAGRLSTAAKQTIRTETRIREQP